MSESASLTSGVAGRYATALFELAKADDAVDALERDLDTLRAAIDESADLRDLIHSPVYRREEQGRAIVAVADAMELSALTRNTLGLMASKRRLFAVPRMAQMALALIADDRGEVTAEVTSARPLSEEQRGRLAEALRSAVGQDVKIQTAVDERLIGGLVVKIGSRMVDTSIRAKLDNMQSAMKEVG